MLGFQLTLKSREKLEAVVWSSSSFCFLPTTAPLSHDCMACQTCRRLVLETNGMCLSCESLTKVCNTHPSTSTAAMHKQAGAAGSVGPCNAKLTMASPSLWETGFCGEHPLWDIPASATACTALLRNRSSTPAQVLLVSFLPSNGSEGIHLSLENSHQLFTRCFRLAIERPAEHHLRSDLEG